MFRSRARLERFLNLPTCLTQHAPIISSYYPAFPCRKRNTNRTTHFLPHTHTRAPPTIPNKQYTMQTGTWSAIGFPVSSIAARERFYEYANWCYQGGVFVSRSSGMLVRLSPLMLWSLPAVQVNSLCG